MSDPKTSIEIIAPSVNEAIARGSVELGLPEDALEVEVIDEGSRGFLGIGSRQVRVRLSIREEYTQLAESPKKEPPAELIPEEEEEAPQDSEEVQDAEVVTICHDTVSELLQRMGIEAEISAHWGEVSEGSHIRPLHVDVRGKDLSILIGRRAETLSALQYVTRLIVGKELKRPVAVVIDVEGYRARRERQLRQLARRMAQQTIERGRTMSLEPMPANERRIIHIELRNHPEVYTESVGEGDRRKVTLRLRSEDTTSSK
jgi:spoIIIJ-associated protein